MITENLSTLKIHKLTQAQYDRELAAGTIDENALYITPDEAIDLSPYATIEQIEGKADADHTHVVSDVTDLQASLDEMKLYTDNAIAEKADEVHTHDDRYYTESEIDNKVSTLNSAISGKAASSHTHTIANVTNLQTQLDAKQATVTGAATTITGSNLTASRALVSNSSGKVAVSAVTSTELGYLDGVTSAIQTQLDGKAASGHTHTYSDVGAAAASHTHSSYVNQNAFSNVTVGETTIAADAATDTLTLVAGSNVTITPDATNDKITIAATDTTYSAAGSALGLVKSGGDVTISSGVITVNDDSHAHTIANVDNLQSTLDAKAASSHAHGNITNAGAIGTAANKAIITTTNGVLTAGTVPVAAGGTGATTAAAALTNLGLTATAAELNVLDGITATVTELNYVDGVTSNIQTQLNAKAASSHTHSYAGSSSAGGDANAAVKLSTARAINGVDFDGTADIDIVSMGGITTAGTGEAYTATVPGITALTAGVSFMMVPHVVSASTTPTLDVNGLGAKQIRRRLSSIATSAQAGYTTTWLAVGKPFRVVYDGMYWIAEGHDKPVSADLYGTVSVSKGGTGKSTLTAGSYLIGNGTDAVNEKTPAEVLADIGAVNKTGDTMTGDLIIQKTTSIANNYPAKLIFEVNQTDNNVATQAFISVYDDHDASTWGTSMVIQSQGNMVIGSGECPTTCYTTDLKANTGENTYIVSDGAINLYTNCNTYTNAKKTTITNTGAMIHPNNTDYTTAKSRNIKAQTSDLTAGSSALANGDICLVYE